MDRTTAAGKVAALNFLMPYVQRLPNRLLRSEWATRIASELRVDEPVLREALRRAATERRSEVKPKAELLAPAVKPAERQLIRMLIEAEGFREKLAHEIISERAASRPGERKNTGTADLQGGRAARSGHAGRVPGRKRPPTAFRDAFRGSGEATWEAAESCLSVLRGPPG